MSKNKNNRNYSYNNQNIVNENTIIEDIESSENIETENLIIEDNISVDEIPNDIMTNDEDIYDVESSVTVVDVDTVSSEELVTIEETSITDVHINNDSCNNDSVGKKDTSDVENVCNVDNNIVCITVAEFKFKVSTNIVNGQMIEFKGGFNDLESACQLANEETKKTGVIHNVYNDQGFVVFSAKKKLTLLTNKKRGNKNVNWYS